MVEQGEDCESGDCCDTSHCKFFGNTTVCGPALRPCDAVEYCTGSSKECPPDRDVAPMTACDDGNSCTQNDVCLYGECAGTFSCACTADNQCVTGNPCMAGVCGSNNTCEFVPRSVGAACNDRSGCTDNDACDGSGQCRGTPKDCSHVSTGCGVGVCLSLGAANSSCRNVIRDAGEVCRNYTEYCDKAEVCTGDVDTCPPDTGSDCRVLGRTCVSGLQYESMPATATSQRQCANATQCASNEFQTKTLDATSDRTCSATPCNFSAEYVKYDRTGVAVCLAITECASDNKETQAPTHTSDRVCSRQASAGSDGGGGAGGINIVVIVAAAVGAVVLILAVAVWKVCASQRATRRRKTARKVSGEAFFINSLFQPQGNGGIVTSTQDVPMYADGEPGLLNRRMETNPVYGQNIDYDDVNNNNNNNNNGGFGRLAANEAYLDSGPLTNDYGELVGADVSAKPSLLTSDDYLGLDEETGSLESKTLARRSSRIMQNDVYDDDIRFDDNANTLPNRVTTNDAYDDITSPSANRGVIANDTYVAADEAYKVLTRPAPPRNSEGYLDIQPDPEP